MISLDSWGGFVLLLLVPLLAWSRYHRTRPREVIVSVFPILRDLETGPPRPARRLTRMSLALRYVLLTTAFLCLALVINGAHLVLERPRTGQWLLVVDNTFAFNTAARRGQTGQIIREGLADLTASLPPEDTVSLITTSPEPVIMPGLSPQQAAGAVGSITASKRTPSVTALTGYLTQMLENSRIKGAVLISPRSHLFPGQLRDRLTIPAPAKVLAGNRGITTADLRPSAAGGFDLSLTIAAAGGAPMPAAVELDPHGITRRFPLPGGGGAQRRFTLKGLELTPGVHTLTLPGGDNLADDDSVSITVPSGEDSLPVALPAGSDVWADSALASLADFYASPEPAGAGIAIYLRSTPSPTPARPFLLVLPTGSSTDFTLRRIMTAPAQAAFSPGHPITSGLSFRNFRPLKLADVTVPGQATVIASAGGMPLVTAGRTDATRYVVWHFDPADGGIYLDPAFPLLLERTLRWLAGKDLEADGLLDAGITREAATVTIPDLTRLAGALPPGSVRLDAARPLLALALLIFLLLVADRALSREVDR